MDPYLEGDDWTSFHTHFATEIARQLTPLLRPKYVALPEKRFEIVDPSGVAVEAMYPDIGEAEAAPSAGETVGMAVASGPYLLETVLEERAPHVWIEIRDVAQRRLVTIIDMLSPGISADRAAKYTWQNAAACSKVLHIS
jgi:hypothetical protein